MSATNIDVIDVSSSDEEVAVPRRRSERKRRLTEKAMENIRQREEASKKNKASKKTKAKVEKASKSTKAKAARKKAEATGEAVAEEAAAEDEDVCPICLDPPVLPVRLECAHVFCFTCAKGLTRENPEDGPGCCSLCRAPIPPGFFGFRLPWLLQRTRDDLASSADNNNWHWFYQARGGGWWKFEARHSEDIEAAFVAGAASTDLLICGKVYTIDLANRVQFVKGDPLRRRFIKRDRATAQSVGVAGVFFEHGE